MRWLLVVALFVSSNLFASFTDEFAISWIKQFGSKGYVDGGRIRGEYDYPTASVVDSNGNMIIVGVTEGNLSGETTARHYCGFVTKLSPTGSRKWINQCKIGDLQYGSAKGVALDRNDNIFITGFSREGAFVAKIDAEGELVWKRYFDIENASEEIYAFYVSGDGIAYVAGVYHPDDYTENSGIFLIRVPRSGSTYFQRTYGSFQDDTRPKGIVEDSQHNIYVGGYTGVDLDGAVNSGSNDIFLTKFDTSGQRLWTKLYGSESAPNNQLQSEIVRAMYIDSHNTIYIAGDTSGNLGGKDNSGNYDMFVAKFSTDGDVLDTYLVGAKYIETTRYGAADHVSDMVVDKEGNIYLFGNTSGQFDGQSNYGDHHDQIALVKLSKTGKYLWAKQFGMYSPNHDDAGVGISQDKYGNLYLSARVSQFLGDYYNTRFPDIAAIKLTPVSRMKFSLVASKRLEMYKAYANVVCSDTINITGIGSESNTTIVSYRYDGNFSKIREFQSDSKQLPGPIHPMTKDEEGNSYVIGYFPTDGGYDQIAISKYTQNGDIVWTKHIAAIGGNAIATSIVYEDGALYICGHTEGNMDEKSDNSGDGIHRADGFILSLNADDGSNRWVDQLSAGTNKPVWMKDIGIDAKGYIHAIGVHGAALGSLILYTYTKNGNIVSVEQYGDNVTANPMGLTIDGNSLYIAATAGGKFTDDAKTYGRSDIVLVKIDKSDESAGRMVWSKIQGSSAYDGAYDIQKDIDGNVLVVGYSNGDLFESNPTATQNIVLELVSKNGDVLASKQGSTDTNDKAYGVNIDATGGVIVTGVSGDHGFVHYYRIEDNSSMQDCNGYLALLEGWNLVSANLNLQTIPDTIQIVWQYHKKKWVAYSPHKQIRELLVSIDDISLLSAIQGDSGAWILSTIDQTISQDVNTTITPKISFENGWSLAGTDRNISTTAIVCSEGELQSLWKYGNGNWKLFAPYIQTTKFASFQTIEKNEGFWVYCK